MPATGIVKDVVSGDLMCYVTLDANGKIAHVGARFELCQHRELIGKKVRLTYQMTNVSDCQSSEPCGKTRRQMLISSMRPA
jgi:hypothetical protein